MNPAHLKPFIAIACGGTGGHLFPGLAVAQQLQARGGTVALMISPKDVDQQAVKSLLGMDIFTLPAVGLQNRNYFSFAGNFWNSFRAARKIFQPRPPAAVLAMGGFTSAPPVFAAKISGARTFLHESNTVPGRANRLLARFVDAAFIGFPETAARLRAKRTSITGTPVRPQFCLGARTDQSAAACRAALGLKAAVKPFLAEMELALGAATIAVSRAGASSLAEMAGMRVPSLLVPLPTAADNHQLFNARAFVASGAAGMLEQNSRPEKMAALLAGLVEDEAARQKMQAALSPWHAPEAAANIAEHILSALGNEFACARKSGGKTAVPGEMRFKALA